MRLLKGALQSDLPDDKYVSKSERATEQDQIKKMLMDYFKTNKKKLVENIGAIAAYANLAVTPGMELGLQSTSKVTSRAEFLAKGLEIWPADPQEVWLDEVGNYVYTGKSLCKKYP